MVEQRQLARSKQIHRETGKTFYVATRFLPERVRHPTYVLYAFFRVADEVVDGDNDLSPAERAERLEEFRRAALGEEPTDDPVLSAFAEIRERHGIPESDVNTFVDAMATDVEKARYETYDELRTYMDGSAAAVGRMMTAVMSPDRGKEALPAATALGEAFQLTNFVRDVREDVIERDRIYLPAETLEAHGSSHEQIARLEFDQHVADAVRAEMERAEALYRDGVAGIELLPTDCQFPVLLAAILYVDHHRLIRNRGYDVVSATSPDEVRSADETRRVSSTAPERFAFWLADENRRFSSTPSLSTRRKLWLAARARLAWQRNPDPRAVFRSVSAIPAGETDHQVRLSTGRLPVP